MARPARVVAPGVRHDLPQCGNHRQDVFFTDADRRGIFPRPAEQADHVGNWRAWLPGEDDAAVRMLRDGTRTGRPCAPAEFVEYLGNPLGPPLGPEKSGREPKRKKRKADRTEKAGQQE